MIKKGTGQPPQTSKSHLRRKGIKAAPQRLNIQMRPWALPRSESGIQSAMTRPRVGKPPAWNMPKRKRTASRKYKASIGPRGKSAAAAMAPVRSDQREDERGQDAPAAEPIAQQSAGHLKSAIGQQERRHHEADLGLIEPQVVHDPRRADREADPMDVSDHGKCAGKAEHFVANPAGPWCAGFPATERVQLALHVEPAHGAAFESRPIERRYSRVRLAIGNGLSNGAGYISCSTVAQPS